MKKTRVSVFLATAFLLFLFIPFFSNAQTDISKDGLNAKMDVTVSGSDILMSVTVTNDSCIYAGSLCVSPEVPEGYSISTNAEPMNIPVGTSHTFEIRISENFPILTVILISVGIVVAIAAVVVILTKKKKAALAVAIILFMGIATISPMASLASAQSQFVPTRNILLSEDITLKEEATTITAKVVYEYDFFEPDAVKTSGMDSFDITYYLGPQGKNIYDDNVIKTIAECGFTSIPLEQNSTETNKKALTVMKKYGLTASALNDQRIQALLYSQWFTQEEIDNVVKTVIDDYAEFDNIKGWFITDEPSTKLFYTLGRIVSAFKRLDPDRSTLINLFPTYASSEALGASSYDEYLNRFVNEVDPSYISYDHYHFLKQAKDVMARRGFFENIERVRKYGLENGLDQMQIVLLTQHFSYGNLTEDELAWEVNMSLVYGMKRMSFFTYWLEKGLLDSGWTNSCVDETGKIYDHYYDIQSINKWLMPLGTQLFDKTSTAVFHTMPNYALVLETMCSEYTSYGDLGEIDAKHFVIGFFDDCSFMVVNKYFLNNEIAHNKFTFIDVTEGLEYFNTETSSWCDALEDGIVTRNAEGRYEKVFNPGQGILFRVK